MGSLMLRVGRALRDPAADWRIIQIELLKSGIDDLNVQTF
jgi:hypothetical protein